MEVNTWTGHDNCVDADVTSMFTSRRLWRHVDEISANMLIVSCLSFQRERISSVGGNPRPSELPEITPRWPWKCENEKYTCYHQI